MVKRRISVEGADVNSALDRCFDAHKPDGLPSISAEDLKSILRSCVLGLQWVWWVCEDKERYNVFGT